VSLRNKVIKERLERIRERNDGVLTPSDVVEDARRATSPLHNFFTWDDTVAAHQYRLDQARTLIRNVKVEVVTTTHTIVAPCYVRDPRVDAATQGYCSTAEIRNESTVAADALRYEFDRAIAMLTRAVAIADALGLGPDVQDLLRRSQVIREAIPARTRPRQPAV